MNKNLVSIIIPAYNGEDFIADAISSALNQTYSHIEVIVYDDASTDQTQSIVNGFNNNRVRYFRSDCNEGLSKNLNKAILKSRGEFICWLNQDDIFMPEKVDVQIKEFSKDPSLGAVFSLKEDIDKKGHLVTLSNPSLFCLKKREEILLFLFQGCFLSAPTVMIKRNVFESAGYFHEGYKIAFDFDMWFRIIKKFNITVIEKPLIKFRHHPNNLSRENSDLPVTLLETCAVILDAIEMFSIEDLFPELKKDFSTSLEKNNAYGNAYLMWARFLFDNKWWSLPLAMPIFRMVLKALSCNSSRASAYLLASKICKESSWEDQSSYYLKIYNERKNHYCRLLDAMEQAIRKGDQTLSSEMTNKVFSIFPDHPDTYFRLHQIFLELGNEQEANYYLKIGNDLVQMKGFGDLG